MKISDLIFGSIFVAVFCMIIYFICERIGIVPIIGISEPNSHFPTLISIGDYAMTNSELVIFMVLILEIVWVGSWILWFKIRKYEVVW